MGKYEELKEFPKKQFKRLTGVQRETFEKMVAILLEAQQKRYRKAGRKGSLSRRQTFNGFRILKRVSNLFSFVP